MYNIEKSSQLLPFRRLLAGWLLLGAFFERRDATRRERVFFFIPTPANESFFEYLVRVGFTFVVLP